MSECIEGIGCRDKDGYVLRRRNGRQWLAHRLAWADANGPIPDGMLVCHHCDTPPCVNVEHLFLGTHKKNVQDMIDKGRRAKLRGSDNGHSKLTEETATYAMARILAGESHQSIADSFGVVRRTIGSLWEGRTWSWLFRDGHEEAE